MASKELNPLLYRDDGLLLRDTESSVLEAHLAKRAPEIGLLRARERTKPSTFNLTKQALRIKGLIVGGDPGVADEHIYPP